MLKVEAIYNLNVQNLPYVSASKTVGIKAKPISSIILDNSVVSKFLIDTLEGKQPIKQGSMFCIGILGDVWQQDSKKLLSKYKIVSIDSEGWLHCEPYPDNEVFAVKITKDLLPVTPNDYFQIIAQWGSPVHNGDGSFKCFVQTGVIGDYVLKSKSDPNDVWIVAEKIFNSTYELKKSK